jgi:hypothetical protein
MDFSKCRTKDRHFYIARMELSLAIHRVQIMNALDMTVSYRPKEDDLSLCGAPKWTEEWKWKGIP